LAVSDNDRQSSDRIPEPFPFGPAPAADSRPGRLWGWAAFLVAATLAAYLPVGGAGFIWDDDTFLWRNPLILGADGLFRLWFTTEAPDYFPLTSTTLWLEWRLWGANPLGYHVVNVLLHAASAVLLWRVLARLKIPGAFLAAAIFAVHPVNVASVAWITERKNTLAMVLYLASLWFYLRAEEERELRPPAGEAAAAAPGFSRFDALSLLAFLGALLSKTAVVPLPVVLLGLAWWRRGRLELRDLGRSLPYFALALAAGVVTVWFQYHRAMGASQLDVRADSLGSRLAGAGWAFWFYLYKALAPLRLSFVYPRWQINPARVASYVPGLLILGLLGIGWRYRRGWGRPGLLGLGYFLVMLLPVLGFLNIYFMRYSLVANHWQYFALIGPIALFAAGFTRAGRSMSAAAGRAGWPRVSAFGFSLSAFGLVLALGVLTGREAATYKNLKTLWTTTLARNPAAGLAHNNLGTLLLEEGRPAEAEAHFRQALALQPKAADVSSNLGGALLAQGRFAEAIPPLQQAIKLQPDSAQAHNNLGSALIRQGRMDEALAHFRRAVELRPGLASARGNLGGALLQAGQADAAIAELQRALELEPDLADAQVSLGNAWLAKGRGADAIACLEKAVRLQPRLAAGHYHLANALLQQGRVDEAIARFQQALSLQPGFAPAHNGLASALLQKGRADEALAHLRAALQIEPRLAEAHLNLANLLLQRKQADEAITHFRAALEIQPGLPAAHNNLASALLARGRVDEAILHCRRALELAPGLAEAHNNLANALLQKGRCGEAAAHYQAAVAARPDHPYLLNNLAWVLATCPEAAARNGARAVELAEQARRRAGDADPMLLGTLAAAYAEAGRFADAVATAQRALEQASAQANPESVAALRAQLERYRSGLPFRDAPPPAR